MKKSKHRINAKSAKERIAWTVVWILSVLAVPVYIVLVALLLGSGIHMTPRAILVVILFPVTCLCMLAHKATRNSGR